MKRKPVFKRWWFWLIVVFLLLASCTNKKEEPQQETSRTVPSTSSPIVTVSPTETPEPTPEPTKTPEPTPEPTPKPTQAQTNKGDNNFDKYDSEEQQNTADKYVLNTHTMKIHNPNCSSVPKISPENYSTSNLSVDELIGQGYSRCGVCNPR